jgi:hypothetical protein
MLKEDQGTTGYEFTAFQKMRGLIAKIHARHYELRGFQAMPGRVS